MATVYSPERTYDTGAKLRCKCDYTSTMSNDKLTVTGTLTLQHNGAAFQRGSLVAGITAGICYQIDTSSTDYYMYPPDGRTDIGRIDSVAKHTSWTNIGTYNFTWNIPRETTTKYVHATFDATFYDGLYGTTNALVSITLTALPSYAVTYNANGGTGAPAAQTKYYGKALTLRTSIPSRAGCRFVGWATSATAATKNDSYDPGDTYSGNAALTLYAVWHAVPSIESLTVIRCDEDGDTENEGEYALITCEWSFDTTVNPGETSANLTATIQPDGGTASSVTFSGTTSGGGGTATAIVGGQDVDTKATVIATAASPSISVYKTAYLSPMFYTLDFRAGGRAVGIGRSAPANGVAIGMDTVFDGDIDLGNMDIPTSSGEEHWIRSNGHLYLVAQNSSSDGSASRRVVDMSAISGYLSTGTLNDNGIIDDALIVNKYGDVSMGFSGHANIRSNHELRHEVYFSSEATHYRFCMTNAGNIRLEQTTDRGLTWTTVDYFARSYNGNVFTAYQRLKATAIDRSVNPSAEQWCPDIQWIDKNSKHLAIVTSHRATGGNQYLDLYVRNENTSGTQVQNLMRLCVGRDGTQTYVVANAANFRSAIGAAASSDRRLKSDISPLGEDAEEFVRSLEPSVYTINGERQVGLIAQDVHDADPWGTRMAFETEEGIDGLDDWEKMEDGSPTWKLDYIRLLPPTIAALQRAMDKIDELEARVAELEARLEPIGGDER